MRANYYTGTTTCRASSACWRPWYADVSRTGVKTKAAIISIAIASGAVMAGNCTYKRVVPMRFRRYSLTCVQVTGCTLSLSDQ